MNPHEAIAKLEAMQSQIRHGSNIFGEIAQLLREASALINRIGTTGVERPDVIERAGKWLEQE